MEAFRAQLRVASAHLKLKGLQPKTIEAYSRAIRRIGERSMVGSTISPSSSLRTTSPNWLRRTRGYGQLDLYGLVYYAHVLREPWGRPACRPPPALAGHRHSRGQQLFAATRVVSYRVFYFTLYSLGCASAGRDCRWGTSMRHADACTSATPRHRVVSFRCRASSLCTLLAVLAPRLLFPIATVV